MRKRWLAVRAALDHPRVWRVTAALAAVLLCGLIAGAAQGSIDVITTPSRRPAPAEAGRHGSGGAAPAGRARTASAWRTAPGSTVSVLASSHGPGPLEIHVAVVGGFHLTIVRMPDGSRTPSLGSRLIAVGPLVRARNGQREVQAFRVAARMKWLAATIVLLGASAALVAGIYLRDRDSSWRPPQRAAADFDANGSSPTWPARRAGSGAPTRSWPTRAPTIGWRGSSTAPAPSAWTSTCATFAVSAAHGIVGHEAGRLADSMPAPADQVRTRASARQRQHQRRLLDLVVGAGGHHGGADGEELDHVRAPAVAALDERAPTMPSA